MARKRKRVYDDHYEDRSTVDPPNHELIQPDVEGAHLYIDQNELPWDLQRHWKHRHDLFHQYDDGIWTTDDSWFEVTPEAVAKMIAKHVGESKPKDRIIMLDCFAGIGGNAIAFALAGYKRVYAIEKNLAALECARHNAKIYGVHNQITFFHGDCFEILGLDDGSSGKKIDDLVAVIRKAGIIFASPPWGGKLDFCSSLTLFKLIFTGPSYKDAAVMDLNTMPYGIDYMFSKLALVTKNIVLYLPRTSDLNQLADCVDEGGKAQIVHYCVKENSKALCAYFGEWADIETSIC